MPNTLTSFNLGASFSGADLPPIAYPLPGMNAGTILMMDFTDARCVSASGAITSDTSIVDLAGVQTGAILEGTLTNKITVSSGLSWPSGGVFSGSGAVKVPMPAFDRTKAHFVSVWMKQTSAPASTYQKMLGIGPAASRTSNANETAIYADTGNAASVGARGTYLVGGTGRGTTATIAGISLNAVVNFGLSWEPGFGMTEWLNGAAARSFSNAATALDAVTNPTLFAAIPFGGKIYALSVERLDLSGRSAAAAAAGEYAARSGKYS